MHSANNPTFLTKQNQINFKLSSEGFSIVENLPVLPYRRTVHLMIGWEMVAKWSRGVGERRYEKVVIIGLMGFGGFIWR